MEKPSCPPQYQEPPAPSSQLVARALEQTRHITAKHDKALETLRAQFERDSSCIKQARQVSLDAYWERLLSLVGQAVVPPESASENPLGWWQWLWGGSQDAEEALGDSDFDVYL